MLAGGWGRLLLDWNIMKSLLLRRHSLSIPPFGLLYGDCCGLCCGSLLPSAGIYGYII